VIGIVVVSIATGSMCHSTQPLPERWNPARHEVATHVPGVAPHSNVDAPGQDTHWLPHTLAFTSSQAIWQVSVPSQPPQYAEPPAVGSGHGVQRVPHVSTEDDVTQALPHTCWLDAHRQTWSVPHAWPVTEHSALVTQPVLHRCVAVSQYFPAPQPVTSHAWGDVGPGPYGALPFDPEDEQAATAADARRTRRRVRIQRSYTVGLGHQPTVDANRSHAAAAVG
jgi:hypothetical protein